MSQVLQPSILAIASGVPKYTVTQSQALEVAKQQCKDYPSIASRLDSIYMNSLIKTRAMSIGDFVSADTPFFDNNFVQPLEKRLAKFADVAKDLVVDVCSRAIAKSGVSPLDIHKLVVVSSTGFHGPGLDCHLIKTLGLPRTTDRTFVGFMGCAAAMNGLRVANDFAKSNPTKKALLCCVELSSVHMTYKNDLNDAILHAIFADGCAACVVGMGSADTLPKGSVVIKGDHSLLTDCEDGIVLNMETNGITCTLSPKLSQYITQSMPDWLSSFSKKASFSKDDVQLWAVHPGGKRILEAVEQSLQLSKTDTACSWKILQDYGNMLSPSVLFVLEELQKTTSDTSRTGLMFSFSPGVGIEGFLFTLV